MSVKIDGVFESAVIDGLGDRGDWPCTNCAEESGRTIFGFVFNVGGCTGLYVAGVEGEVEVGDIQSVGGRPTLDLSPGKELCSMGELGTSPGFKDTLPRRPEGPVRCKVDSRMFDLRLRESMPAKCRSSIDLNP